MFLIILIFNLSFASNPFTLQTKQFQDTKLNDEEAYAIVSHPIYADIYSQKVVNERKFLEIKSGVSIKQFKQNTGNIVNIGSHNLFPTLLFNGTLWVFDWFGLTGSWERGHLFTTGTVTAEGQSSLIMPTWTNYGAKLRYNFDKRDSSSYIAFKAMVHEHKFPVLTDNPTTPSLYNASGISFGAQRSFALNESFGFDFNFDFILLDSVREGNINDGAQPINLFNSSGLGYAFTVDFYGSIIDMSGLKTQITIGYGLYLYSISINPDMIEALHGLSQQGVDIVYKDFQQIYQGLHITFSARI